MEENKNSRLGVIVTASVVSVIVIAGVASYIGYRVGRSVQKAQTQEDVAINTALESLANTPINNTPTTEDTETPDTSSWSTYSNTSYPFTFKYPTDWETEDLVVIEPYTGTIGIRPKSLKEDYILLIHAISPSLQSFEDTVARFKTNMSDNSKNIAETTGEKFGKTNVTKVTYMNKISGYTYSEYFVSQNNKIYQITGESNDPANTTANHILETLTLSK